MRSRCERIENLNITLVAPPGRPIPDAFTNVVRDAELYETTLHALQKVRGKVYLEDGEIPPTALDAEGRHVSSCDDVAWHMLLQDEAQGIHGTIRMPI